MVKTATKVSHKGEILAKHANLILDRCISSLTRIRAGDNVSDVDVEQLTSLFRGMGGTLTMPVVNPPKTTPPEPSPTPPETKQEAPELVVPNQGDTSNPLPEEESKDEPPRIPIGLKEIPQASSSHPQDAEESST